MLSFSVIAPSVVDTRTFSPRKWESSLPLKPSYALITTLRTASKTVLSLRLAKPSSKVIRISRSAFSVVADTVVRSPIFELKTVSFPDVNVVLSLNERSPTSVDMATFPSSAVTLVTPLILMRPLFVISTSTSNAARTVVTPLIVMSPSESWTFTLPVSPIISVLPVNVTERSCVSKDISTELPWSDEVPFKRSSPLCNIMSKAPSSAKELVASLTIILPTASSICVDFPLSRFVTPDITRSPPIILTKDSLPLTALTVVAPFIVIELSAVMSIEPPAVTLVTPCKSTFPITAVSISFPTVIVLELMATQSPLNTSAVKLPSTFVT